MSYPSRRLLPMITRLVLAILVFGQLALAAEACALSVTPSAMQYKTSDEMPGCDNMSSTACVIHLTQDNKSSDMSFPPALPAAVSLSVLYLIPVVPAATFSSTHQPVVSLYAQSDPPLSVRFCSFQI